MLKTVRTIKRTVTVLTIEGRGAATVVVRAGLLGVSTTGAAGAAFTGVFVFCTGVKPAITKVAPIGPVDEGTKACAPIVMVVAFDQQYLVRGVGSSKDHKEGFTPAHHLQLVLGGQDALKGVELF